LIPEMSKNVAITSRASCVSSLTGESINAISLSPVVSVSFTVAMKGSRYGCGIVSLISLSVMMIIDLGLLLMMRVKDGLHL